MLSESTIKGKVAIGCLSYLLPGVITKNIGNIITHKGGLTAWYGITNSTASTNMSLKE